MKKEKITYALGCIILFLGLLWMFIPHTYHNEVLQGDESSHLTHTFEGALATVLGLVILVVSNKSLRKQNFK